MSKKKKKTKLLLDMNIFKMSELKLQEYLYKIFKKDGRWDVVLKDSYLYLRGGGKVLINCHMDVVYSWSLTGNDKVYFIDNYIWSPKGCGGDDRCGVQIAKWFIDNNNFAKDCDFLFTRGEERGLVGAREFVKDWKDTVDYLALIGLDREGTGFVLYSYEYGVNGMKWKDYIEKITGRKCEKGSVSDISAMTSFGVKGVNLGVGYKNNHWAGAEYVVVSDMTKCYVDLKKLVKDLIVNDYKWKHEDLWIEQWQNKWKWDWDWKYGGWSNVRGGNVNNKNENEKNDYWRLYDVDWDWEKDF